MSPTRLEEDEAAHPRQREQQDHPFQEPRTPRKNRAREGDQRDRQERQAGQGVGEHPGAPGEPVDCGAVVEQHRTGTQGRSDQRTDHAGEEEKDAHPLKRLEDALDAACEAPDPCDCNQGTRDVGELGEEDEAQRLARIRVRPDVPRGAGQQPDPPAPRRRSEEGCGENRVRREEDRRAHPGEAGPRGEGCADVAPGAHQQRRSEGPGVRPRHGVGRHRPPAARRCCCLQLTPRAVTDFTVTAQERPRVSQGEGLSCSQGDRTPAVSPRRAPLFQARLSFGDGSRKLAVRAEPLRGPSSCAPPAPRPGPLPDLGTKTRVSDLFVRMPALQVVLRIG